MSRFDGFSLDELRKLAVKAMEDREKAETLAADCAQRLKPIQDERASALSRAALCRTELEVIGREISRRTAVKPEPTVTDHALLRYLERHLDLNVEAVRKRMMTDQLVKAINAGATSFRGGDGLTYHIKGNSVTTVLDSDPHPRPERLTRAKRERLEEDDWDGFEVAPGSRTGF